MRRASGATAQRRKGVRRVRQDRPDHRCRREQDGRPCPSSPARSAIRPSISASSTRTPGYFTFDPGFMATASVRSAVTFIDGDAGVLLYRGYPIEQLAKQSSFLEVAYLLINGELPTHGQVLGVRARSHASHDDARGAEELPARLPLRRASDGDPVRVGRLAVGVLPRHARHQRSRAAPPRGDPPDREDADDRRRRVSLFDRLADPLSAQQPRIRRRASCT